MLVLARRKRQSIVITDPTTGERLTVTVTSIEGEQVKLGVTAPREWAVHRLEVQDEIDREGSRKS